MIRACKDSSARRITAVMYVLLAVLIEGVC